MILCSIRGDRRVYLLRLDHHLKEQALYHVLSTDEYAQNQPDIVTASRNVIAAKPKCSRLPYRMLGVEVE